MIREKKTFQEQLKLMVPVLYTPFLKPSVKSLWQSIPVSK